MPHSSGPRHEADRIRLLWESHSLSQILVHTRATLEMSSLEDVRLTEKGDDVFLSCVHILEFMDWLIKSDKCMNENWNYVSP